MQSHRKPEETSVWSEARAADWYAQQPWFVGCNFIPSTAVNQLEMWQKDTFDAQTNRRELGWAAELGMNTVRVFLHDLLFHAEGPAFLDRLDSFLSLCDGAGLRVMPVLFDDCWHEGARLGPQKPPVPGIHNSRWVQSPGTRAAQDPGERERLRAYVEGVVGRFASDRRVLVWDIYNEVGNVFLPLLSQHVLTAGPALVKRFVRFRLSLPPSLGLLEDAFAWARGMKAEQPLTAGIWIGHGRLNERLAELSDVVSFHNYENADNLEKQIASLAARNRPLFCTEYMARPRGSLFQTALSVFRRHKVACYNWGLVSGRTQTRFSWSDRSGREPKVWFHDVLRPDGTPYDAEETDLLRRMTRGA